ncbi:MAG: sugar phosphate isomerase/epimerase [Lentisphaerae bacterium]|nr:sugar phosphate isomerase/epimerase [Lentisphaerota bacterium]
MKFSVSTHWNAFAHDSGEGIIDDILELGLDTVELGYDLRMDQVPGIRRRVEEGAVRVRSVHNYCPTPVGAMRGHPEIFLMSSEDERTRNSAVLHISNTIQFAAELGAEVVVVHAGRVSMRHLSSKLLRLYADGEQYSKRYEKMRTKLFMKREKLAAGCLERITGCLTELLPFLEKHNIRMGIENLPSWEVVPNESELMQLMETFDSPHICAWHDTGHGRLREILGFSSATRWLEKYGSRLTGMHIHDVSAAGQDHVMPPLGTMDFTAFKPFIRSDMVLAFEPAPGTPAAEVSEGLRIVGEAWRDDSSAGEEER